MALAVGQLQHAIKLAGATGEGGAFHPAVIGAVVAGFKARVEVFVGA